MRPDAAEGDFVKLRPWVGMDTDLDEDGNTGAAGIAIRCAVC